MPVQSDKCFIEQIISPTGKSLVDEMVKTEYQKQPGCSSRDRSVTQTFIL